MIVELLEVLFGYLLLKGGLVLLAYYLLGSWLERKRRGRRHDT